MRKLTLILGLIFFVPSLQAAPSTGIVLLPLNCSELLPETEPFIDFFEAVAQGQVRQDPSFAQKMFKVMALRRELERSFDGPLGENPVDILIRKTLCYYRQQKEPVRPIPYDDFKFVNFMKAGIDELEESVGNSIYEMEFAKQQRELYTKQLERNRRIIGKVKAAAEKDAEKAFERLSKKAERRVKDQRN